MIIELRIGQIFEFIIAIVADFRILEFFGSFVGLSIGSPHGL
jgi:hypothetical protein